MEPITIKLSHPVEAFGEQVSELVIKKRPKAKDLRAMDSEKGEVGKTAALMAQLTGVPSSTIDQLDAADFMKASEVVEGFLS